MGFPATWLGGGVSCIVPTYEDRGTLRRALKSVVESRYPVCEIVVIDDGSKNSQAAATVESMRAETDVVIVLHRREHGGPAAARNTGLGLAQGEWVIFLDADDELLPDSIDNKIDHAGKCGESIDVAGIYGSFIWSTTGAVQQFKNSFEKVSRDQVGVLGKVPGGVPSYLLNKNSLISVGGFDESLFFNEDIDILLRLIGHGHSLIGSSAPGFVRNVSDQSLTKSNPVRSIRGSYAFLRKAYRERLLSRREAVRRMIINRAILAKLLAIRQLQKFLG